MVFLFRSEKFFSDNTSQNIFFCRAQPKFFFPEFNIKLYDKNCESDFFFLHQNQNIFFSNIGNQNMFLEKNHNPPPLEVKWSFPKEGKFYFCSAQKNIQKPNCRYISLAMQNSSEDTFGLCQFSLGPIQDKVHRYNRKFTKQNKYQVFTI